MPTIDVRLAGGQIIVEPATWDVTGFRYVQIDIPGTNPLMLTPSEAVALAEALKVVSVDITKNASGPVAPGPEGEESETTIKEIRMPHTVVPTSTDASTETAPTNAYRECEEVDAVVDSDESCRLFPEFEEIAPLEAEWAQQNLNLPTIITFHKSRPVSTWKDSGGAWYRSAGYVIASPGTFDKFRIVLYRGATDADLQWLKIAVGLAKLGYFTRHGWQEIAGYDRQYAYDWSRTIESEDDPGPVAHIYAPCELTACTEPGCGASVHAVGETILHEADKIEGEGYEVMLEALESAGRHEPWVVSIDVGEGAFTPAVAAGLASHIQYLTAECRKLNEQRQAAL